MKNRKELQPIVAEILLRRSRAYWVQRLGEVGVPCGSIRTIAEVCEAEQLVSRGMVISMEHPTAGTVRNIDSPVRINGRNAVDDRAPPLLGADTHFVLEKFLGLSDAEITRLEAAGAVRRGSGAASPGAGT